MNLFFPLIQVISKKKYLRSAADTLLHAQTQVSAPISLRFSARSSPRPKTDNCPISYAICPNPNNWLKFVLRNPKKVTANLPN